MGVPWTDQLLLFNGAGSFSPKNISGLVMWLRGDASSITLNGSNVANWADQSGNGNDVLQATAAKQPAYTASSATFNNKPCIQSDGVDDVLASSGNVFPATTYSLIAVLSTISLSTGEYFCKPSAGGNDSEHFYGAAETTFQRFNGVSVTLTSQTASIITYTVTGANETISLNGGTPVTGSSAPVAAANIINIFGVGATPLLPRAYKLAELIIYNKVLSASEQRYIQAGLASRYAITLS